MILLAYSCIYETDKDMCHHYEQSKVFGVCQLDSKAVIFNYPYINKPTLGGCELDYLPAKPPKLASNIGLYEANREIYHNCEHLNNQQKEVKLMTIYEELIERVSNGEPFHIDFEKRNMTISKQKIIVNGKCDAGREFIKFDGYVLKTIYELYQNYKYSLPSERSDSKRKKYFKALSIDELTDEQLMLADRREVAAAALEGFILCNILNRSFVWDEKTMGSWFWQSKNDPDLVILRDWVEGK